MSHKCYSSSFKLTVVAVAEAQGYLFPSIASDCLSYKRQSRINRTQRIF